MKDIKLVTSPNVDGRVPVRSLFDTSKDDRIRKLFMLRGNGPVK
jgi:hypothetical protein